MKYMLRTPDGKLALFDDRAVELDCWDVDPSTDLDEVQKDFFRQFCFRLVMSEAQNALDDLSTSGDDEAPHPQKLNRWEQAIRCIVMDRDVDHAARALELLGFPDYPISESVLAEKRRQDERIRSTLNPHAPMVDSTKDEALWAEI